MYDGQTFTPLELKEVGGGEVVIVTIMNLKVDRSKDKAR